MYRQKPAQVQTRSGTDSSLYLYTDSHFQINGLSVKHVVPVKKRPELRILMGYKNSVQIKSLVRILGLRLNDGFCVKDCSSVYFKLQRYVRIQIAWI